MWGGGGREEGVGGDGAVTVVDCCRSRCCLMWGWGLGWCGVGEGEGGGRG